MRVEQGKEKERRRKEKKTQKQSERERGLERPIVILGCGNLFLFPNLMTY